MSPDDLENPPSVLPYDPLTNLVSVIGEESQEDDPRKQQDNFYLDLRDPNFHAKLKEEILIEALKPPEHEKSWKCVKVFFYQKKKWETKGTGYLDLQEERYIFLVTNKGNILLQSEVKPENVYHSSEEIILLWYDQNLNYGVALMFQNREALHEAQRILNVLQSQFQTSGEKNLKRNEKNLPPLDDDPWNEIDKGEISSGNLNAADAEISVITDPDKSSLHENLETTPGYTQPEAFQSSPSWVALKDISEAEASYENAPSGSKRDRDQRTFKKCGLDGLSKTEQIGVECESSVEDSSRETHEMLLLERLGTKVIHGPIGKLILSFFTEDRNHEETEKLSVASPYLPSKDYRSDLCSFGVEKKMSFTQTPSLTDSSTAIDTGQFFKAEADGLTHSFSFEQLVLELNHAFIALYQNGWLLSFLGAHPTVLKQFLDLFPTDPEAPAQQIIVEKIVEFTRLILALVCARPNHNIFVALLGTYETIRRLILILEFDKETNPRHVPHDQIVSSTIDKLTFPSVVPWNATQLRKVKYIYALGYLRDSVAPCLVENDTLSGGVLPSHLNKMKLECYNQIFCDESIMWKLCETLDKSSLGLLYEILSHMKTNFFQLNVFEKYADVLLRNQFLHSSSHMTYSSDVQKRGIVSDMWYQLICLRTDRIREDLIGPEEELTKYPLLTLMINRLYHEPVESIRVQWREGLSTLLTESMEGYISSCYTTFCDIFFDRRFSLFTYILEQFKLSRTFSWAQLSFIVFCIKKHWCQVAEYIHEFMTAQITEKILVETTQPMIARLGAADILKVIYTSCSQTELKSFRDQLCGMVRVMASRGVSELLQTTLLSVFTSLYRRQCWSCLLYVKAKTSHILSKVPVLQTLLNDIETRYEAPSDLTNSYSSPIQSIDAPNANPSVVSVDKFLKKKLFRDLKRNTTKSSDELDTDLRQGFGSLASPSRTYNEETSNDGHENREAIPDDLVSGMDTLMTPKIVYQATGLEDTETLAPSSTTPPSLPLSSAQEAETTMEMEGIQHDDPNSTHSSFSSFSPAPKLDPSILTTIARMRSKKMRTALCSANEKQRPEEEENFFEKIANESLS